MKHLILFWIFYMPLTIIIIFYLPVYNSYYKHNTLIRNTRIKYLLSYWLLIAPIKYIKRNLLNN